MGSGAVPLSVAVTLGGFGEWLGATLLGYGVSDTIKKGVADTTDPDCWACGYCDSDMSVYALGMLSALIGVIFSLAACCHRGVDSLRGVIFARAARSPCREAPGLLILAIAL